MNLARFSKFRCIWSLNESAVAEQNTTIVSTFTNMREFVNFHRYNKCHNTLVNCEGSESKLLLQYY